MKEGRKKTAEVVFGVLIEDTYRRMYNIFVCVHVDTYINTHE